MARSHKGRPSRLVPSVIDKLCEAMEVGANYADAAAYARIAPSTLSLWRQRGEELFNRIQEVDEPIELSDYEAKLLHFWTRFAEAEAVGIVNCETVVYNEAMRNPDMALKVLERRRSEDWSPRNRQEVSGPSGGPVETVVRFEEAENWRGGNRVSDSEATSGTAGDL